MAATDLLSLNEGAYALGLGTLDVAVTTARGTLLAQAISGVSNRLAGAVGTIIYGTITAELHSGGGNVVYLRESPVAQIVQVVEYDNTTASTLTAETNTTKTSTNYLVNLNSGRIVRRDTNADARYPVGSDNVLVTYVAGRYASTATVGPLFKEAAAIFLKNIWRTYESSASLTNEFDVPISSFPHFGIPNAVKELLADEWREGSGIGD